MQGNKKLSKYGIIFILPFLIVYLLFNIYPILRTLYLSFTNFRGYGEATFIGIQNYSRLVSDDMFIQSFFNTLKIWGLNIVVQLGMALGLTIIFSDIRYKVKGLSVYRAIFFLPNLIATASVALLFQRLLDWQYGPVNQILLNSGVIDKPINWFGEPTSAIVIVSLIGAWMWFGNSFIVLMAGVQGISKDYYEAADIDGASRLQVLRYITIPLLKPVLIYVGITSLIGGLQIFDLPFLITDGIGAPRGALNTMVMYLYNTMFRYSNVGYAAAIAYGIFFIIIGFSLVLFKFVNKKEKEVRS
ncbi:MAG: carbohydrate ABC transporter permease [Cetobacterium sp.]|uniref:carbohydrate ABC transporter permease n=1 Tax=Cetobacterium sp. TaxID=2071632 RepID=UPI0025FBB594|nr:sugar ABC transporter permease [uncultured Cetobacterium sp.]